MKDCAECNGEEIAVALDWNCAEKLAALSLGCVGIALGDPGTIVGGIVSGVGIVGAFRAAKAKFGMESDRHLKRTREEVLAGFEAWARDQGITEADLRAADLALDRHLAECIPDLSTLAQLAYNRERYPAAAAEHVVAELAKREGLFREGAPQFVPLAREFALRVVERALVDAMQQEQYAARLRTEMLAQLSQALSRVEGKVDAEAARSASADARHDDKLDALVAEVKAMRAEAGNARVSQDTILEIARRVAPQIDDVSTAISQINALVDEVIVLRDRTVHGSNLGDLIDDALRRIAERNDRDAFDEAASIGEQAYAALLSRQRAERSALAEAMISQSRVRVDAAALAHWLEERIRIERPELAAAHLFEQIGLSREQGLRAGSPLDLHAALLMAERALTVASGKHERASAANWIGIVANDLAKLRSDQGAIMLMDTAAEAFRTALDLLADDASALDSAAGFNNLGSVLRDKAERLSGEEAMAAIDEAVVAIGKALAICEEVSAPSQRWAMILSNYANALLLQGKLLGGTDGSALIAKAVEVHETTLEALRREDHDLIWAAAQEHLGIARFFYGVFEPNPAGDAQLRGAIENFKSALEVHTEEDTPAHRATTLNNLGNAYSVLGQRTPGDEGTAMLGEAVRLYQAVLKVRSRARMPGLRAQTQSNLGKTFLALAARCAPSDRRANLENAIAAFVEAVTAFSKDPDSRDHVEARENLALARSRMKDVLSAG